MRVGATGGTRHCTDAIPSDAMAKETYEQFVTAVANAVNNFDYKIELDQQIHGLHAGSEPFEERLARASEHWNSRPTNATSR